MGRHAVARLNQTGYQQALDIVDAVMLAFHQHIDQRTLNCHVCDAQLLQWRACRGASCGTSGMPSPPWWHWCSRRCSTRSWRRTCTAWAAPLPSASLPPLPLTEQRRSFATTVQVLELIRKREQRASCLARLFCLS